MEANIFSNLVNNSVIVLMRDLKQQLDTFTKTFSATVGSTRLANEEIIHLIENITSELLSVKNDVRSISKTAKKGNVKNFGRKPRMQLKRSSLAT